MHKAYKEECLDVLDIVPSQVLSRISFVRLVKFIIPTLQMGKRKIDVCNACFRIDMQKNNPESSAELREELKEAKKVHLKDAINARKAINTLV